MIREKIEAIVAMIKKDTDDISARQLEYVQGMIDDAVNYVRAVVTMEARIQILSFRLEPEDYRIAVEQLDRTRRIAHDSFIAKLSVVNRICLQMDTNPIYDGSDHRADKGEFAFALVEEYKINVRG